MKLTRSFLAIAISFSLVFVSTLGFSIQKVSAQDSQIALQRGYRTGYSDGYMAGYRDVIEKAARNFQRHDEYVRADRAYAKEYGSMEDYRDGYQQGFEIGYDTGFDKREFDAALPNDLKRRGTVTPTTTLESTTTVEPLTVTASETKETDKVSTTEQKTETINYVPSSDQTVIIPVDTELIVELSSDINTKQNKEGDKFQARVVSPVELNGAMIEGRISKIQKPGRIKRRAEMQLSFSQIRLSDNRWSNYNAVLTEVLPIKGDNVKRVDTEGTVEGKSSMKSDAIKVGAGAGTGAVVGGLVGGPVGVVVGAGIGAAIGVGASVIKRGKDVNLVKGQQLRIKTAYETQIR